MPKSAKRRRPLKPSPYVAAVLREIADTATEMANRWSQVTP